MTWYYRLASICNPLFLIFIRTKSRFSGSRVRIVVRNTTDEVLLIKSVFGMTEWEFPGGEVGYGETVLAAAVRELKEETALVVLEDKLVKKESLLQPFAIELLEYTEPITSNAHITRPWEIREIRWCKSHALPVDTANYVKSFLLK